MNDDLVRRLNGLAAVEGKPTAGALKEAADRIEKLEAALRPFARAEYISTGFDGNAIFARLQYAKDATETIPLAALEEARKALEGKDDIAD